MKFKETFFGESDEQNWGIVISIIFLLVAGVILLTVVFRSRKPGPNPNPPPGPNPNPPPGPNPNPQPPPGPNPNPPPGPNPNPPPGPNPNPPPGPNPNPPPGPNPNPPPGPNPNPPPGPGPNPNPNPNPPPGPGPNPNPNPNPPPSTGAGKDKFDPENVQTRTISTKNNPTFRNFMFDAVETKKGIVNITPRSLTVNEFGTSNAQRLALAEVPNPFLKMINQPPNTVNFLPNQYLAMVYPQYPLEFLATDVDSYVDFVYEPFASQLFKSKTNGINFKTKTWETPEGILFDRTDENLRRRYYRTRLIEVINQSVIYDNTNPDTKRDNFQGTWYDVCSGSGYFLPIRECLLCKNTVHLTNLLDLDEKTFAKWAHPEFKSFVFNESNRQLLPWKNSEVKPTDTNFNLDRQILAERLSSTSSSLKISYMGPTPTAIPTQSNNLEFNKTVRFLVYHAGIRGFRTIQILNEWDQTISNFRNLFCHIIDPIMSNRTIEKSHWWAMGPNPSSYNMDLYSLFLTGHYDEPVHRPFKPNIAAIDPVIQRCTDMKGTLSINDGWRDCLQIRPYVGKDTPITLLFKEDQLAKVADLPKTTREDKLRSYWILVYGNKNNVWQSKSLEVLERLWKDKEVLFQNFARQVGLPDNDIVTAGRIQYYKDADPDICKKFGHCAIDMEVRQEFNRPLELMKYIEVVRANSRYSHFQEIDFFAATWYYPVNGSGLWVPTGILAVSGNKSNFLQNFQENVDLEGQFQQDAPLSRSAIMAGADTLLMYRFLGRTELCTFKDYISTQASVFRMDPFDPRANEPSDTFFIESGFPVRNVLYDAAQRDVCFFSFKKYYPSNGLVCTAREGTF